MDRAARCVMHEFSDIVLAFGESDEYRCAAYSLSLIWLSNY